MLGRSCGSCTWAHADGGEQGAYGGAINSVSSGAHGRVRRRRVHVLVERQVVELRQALVLVLASLVPEPHESEELTSLLHISAGLHVQRSSLQDSHEVAVCLLRVWW